MVVSNGKLTDPPVNGAVSVIPFLAAVLDLTQGIAAGLGLCYHFIKLKEV